MVITRFGRSRRSSATTLGALRAHRLRGAPAPVHWLTLALVVGLLQATAAQAQTGDGAAGAGRAQASGADTTNTSNTDRMLAAARESVRRAAEGLARGVDSWFGDKPFEAGGQVTEGRLSIHLLSRQHETIDPSVRFHARWRLPNLSERSYLYLGQGDRRELVSNLPEALSRTLRLQPARVEDRGFFAGLGVTLRDTFEFRLGFRGGLKPYSQVSCQLPWQLAPPDRVEFRETVFWALDDRLGTTTALSYEHTFSPTLTVRWLNAAIITQQVRHADWSSKLGAYKAYGNQRLLSVEALASGLQGSGVAVADYGLQAKWEQPIHRDWLVGEVLVGHFWPKRAAQGPRETAWAVGSGLKLTF